jgi:hypothetical protein
MNDVMNKVLVRKLLEQAQDLAWVMQDIGLLGLRLDERREYRIHVWDPDYATSEPPVHDHPFDFTSTIIAGEMTNTRYEGAISGAPYTRWRYTPANENARRADTVRLSATPTTYKEGDRYSQLAHELHSSHQLPGTVTIIQRQFRDLPVPELTVCWRHESTWVSGQSRPATSEEVRTITTRALAWF